MRRRSLLTAVSAVVTGGVTGCLSDVAPVQSTATYTRVAPSPTPVRGRGEPISVERSLSDEPGYEDDREYFPANKTVRYVAATSGGEPVDFETISFEEWAPTKSTEVGMKRVQEVTPTRLGTDEFTAGMGVPPESAQTEGLVIWLTVATRTDDGETISTPTVPLPRLADVAPRSVDVTISIEGDAFSRTVPVFARHLEEALL